MNEFNDGSVAFLEDDDIDENGHLKIKDPTVVMIMGDYCGYCKQAAPEFHKFALKHKNKAFMAAILLDGLDTEKKLGQRVSSFVPGFQGVPTFVLFKNGKYVKTHSGPRTLESLEKFLNS